MVFELDKVCCGNGGEKLLQLAEGLLKKHISSHSLHEPEGKSFFFFFFLLVLVLVGHQNEIGCHIFC